MQITSNFNKEAEVAKETAKTEVFEGHNVVDGKVQGNWSDWSPTNWTSLSSLQKKYDEQKAASAEKSEAYSWNPLTMIKNTANWILDAFKSLLCCGAKDNADEAEGTKKDDKAAKTAE